MTRKPLPTQLLETRPAVQLDIESEHPENGPKIGVPRGKYTKAVHDSIVSSIEKGNRPHIAAAIAGITSTTFAYWMQKGNEGHPHYWEFVRDIEQASAVAEGKAIATLSGPEGDFAIDSDNAKWWLERSRADGYSKESNTKVNAMLEEFFKRLETSLPPTITSEMLGKSIFQMVIAAASGQTITTARATFQLVADTADNGSEEETTE